MSKLPTTPEPAMQQIDPFYPLESAKTESWFTAEQMQDYATAATEPLLQRIAELEQRNRDLYEDVQRFREHAMNEKAARMDLERQLEEARNDAERLDYIQKNARSDPKMDGNHVWWPTTLNQAQNLKGPTIRAAIDAAMKGTP